MTEQELTELQKSKIIEVLDELGAVQTCPRCGNESFLLMDYIFDQKSPLRNYLVPEEPKIPSIIVVCDRCGFISQHALAVLKKLIEEKQIKSI